jgi:predicted nucleotidyltransferase
MNPHAPLLRKCRAVLESLYRSRLKAVILYGSTARGDDTPDSDIDLLVLLDGPVDVGDEIFRIWDVLYPVQLESDRVISVLPADARSYRQGACRLYQNVQEEGVLV